MLLLKHHCFAAAVTFLILKLIFVALLSLMKWVYLFCVAGMENIHADRRRSTNFRRNYYHVSECSWVCVYSTDNIAPNMASGPEFVWMESLLSWHTDLYIDRNNQILSRTLSISKWLDVRLYLNCNFKFIAF